MKTNPDFERLSFAVSFKIADGGDDSLVEGYGNCFENLDQNGDIVHRGAFKKTIKERVDKGMVPYIDTHQWDAAHVLGTVMSASEDEKGLKFLAKLASTPDAQQIKQKMIEGHIKRNSIGFAPVQERYERQTGDKGPGDMVRHLDELKLFEISCVPIAANEESMITGVKAAVPFQDLAFADRDRAWDAGEARKRIAEWAGGSGDSKINWSKYRRAFLWYDRAKADEAGAYKLPIADVIGGELKAIPRAIFAAAAIVQGARGGADLGGDEEAVKAHLERYYAKMAKEFDDESIVAPWNQKSPILLLDDLAVGVYQEKDIRTAQLRLWAVSTPGQRAALLAELKAEPPENSSTHREDGGAGALDALRARAARTRSGISAP
jgi:HK97 family phage prohead protease